MVNILIFIIIFGLILLFYFIFSKQENIKNEMLSIDHTNVSKGIASVMIVLHHIGANEGTVVFSPFGGIGVCIFLICSGYGLSISYKKYGLKNFIVKRFSRILIPYFIVNLLVWTYFYFINKDYLTLANTYIYWFVYYIIIIYAIFYIVYRFYINTEYH